VPDRLCYAFAYHPSQWSIVFPLGMYGTATLALSRLTGFAALAFLGRGFVWSAFGAWLALALLAAAAEVGGGPAGMGAPEVSRRAAQAVSPAGSPRLGHDSLPCPVCPAPRPRPADVYRVRWGSPCRQSDGQSWPLRRASSTRKSSSTLRPTFSSCTRW
jgi:hypothetical protein